MNDEDITFLIGLAVISNAQLSKGSQKRVFPYCIVLKVKVGAPLWPYNVQIERSCDPTCKHTRRQHLDQIHITATKSHGEI